MGGRTPDTTKSQPKDTLHTGAPNTAATTTKWGSHMQQRGHADTPHLQQHMAHVRTVQAITASQVSHDPLTFHLPHNKSQPEPEQA